MLTRLLRTWSMGSELSVFGNARGEEAGVPRLFVDGERTRNGESSHSFYNFNTFFYFIFVSQWREACLIA